MRRRDFIAGLGSAAAWPALTRAQQPPMPVIGFLSSVGPADAPAQLAAFHTGLGEAGYFERKNVAIEFRWAENKADRLPELARDLVQRGVVAIGAFGNAAAGGHGRAGGENRAARSWGSGADALFE